MKKNLNDYAVALIVIACSVVLLAALAFSITGNPFNSRHLEFTADFSDITGIGRNSDVLFQGDKVGVVTAVEHITGPLKYPGRPVRLHIAINKAVEIPANVKIFISSESMLGAKHIALQRVADSSDDTLEADCCIAGELPGGMIDQILPNSGTILANVETITESLKMVTERLAKGEIGRHLTETLTNLEGFSEKLSERFTGTESREGIADAMDDFLATLNEVADGISEFVEGDSDGAVPGLAVRGDAILANLEDFSRELNYTIAGSPDGEPGLREKIGNIANDAEAILAGAPDGSDPGMRRKFTEILAKVDTVVEEMNALVVWGSYITGTLAEKPNRLIFGSRENEVPTKEQIIAYLREYRDPYPVVIKANNPKGDPRLPNPAQRKEAAATASEKPEDGLAPERPLFKLRPRSRE